MRPTDVELQTAAGKPTSVLALLDEMRHAWPKGDDARARARSMERWVYNRINGKSLALETQVAVPMSTPPVSKNKVRGGLLTWAARTTKRRDTALAYANEATEGDLASAEVANAVLDYQRQMQDRDALMMRAVILAGMHGTVGLYNTYDPDAGPHKEREVVLDRYGVAPLVDPLTGEMQYKTVEGRGNPMLEALSIFDFITSGEKESHKGKWALVRRWLDPDEAASLLRVKAEALQQELQLPSLPNLEPSIEAVQARSGHGPTRECVEAYEMWWRPNKHGRLPEGLFAAVVSGYVVTATTFPYAHGELPLVTLRTMDIEDDFYGATWLEDAIPQQMGLNHSLRVLAHRAEVAGQVRIMVTDMVANKWNEGMDGFIPLTSKDDVQNGAKAFEVPPIPADMYTMCDRYEQGIDDCSGVSGVSSSGDTAAETKNARLVAYATQIDEQKNEHTLRNLQEAELVVDKQQLMMFQQFVPRQRLIRIIGEDNAVSASYFSGAEIQGVDVRLEAAPAAERSRAGIGKDAEERAAQGLEDPSRAAEKSETGLSSTLDEGEQRQKIGGLIQQALAGAHVQADMTINPDVAVQQLRMAVEQFAIHGPKVVMPLRALLQEYLDLASQGKQQGMPSPQGGGGRTGAPQNGPMNQLPTSGGAQ